MLDSKEKPLKPPLFRAICLSCSRVEKAEGGLFKYVTVTQRHADTERHFCFQCWNIIQPLLARQFASNELRIVW